MQTTDHTLVWVALINALSATAAAIIAAFGLRQSKKNASKVNELKKNTDGMQDTLLNLSKAQGRAEGVAEGRESAVIEKQARTIEAERVEDRQAEKSK